MVNDANQDILISSKVDLSNGGYTTDPSYSNLWKGFYFLSWTAWIVLQLDKFSKLVLCIKFLFCLGTWVDLIFLSRSDE